MIAYAVCSDVCVPYQAELSLSLPVGTGTVAPEASLIESARKSVPGTMQAAGIDIVAIHVEGDWQNAGSSSICAAKTSHSSGRTSSSRAPVTEFRGA